ncbi:uncharacterized protein PHACADRAFT_211566 [Phanerochaete carnosa HHB-10118-sp]|uniref:DUF6534 domain-containing protein n=1 Tax=Phanerochaete carnosa (strain HHB-10118-sp) TaxID=650164 RepID=K5WPQ2_PHACS|nr:uncharacterized protein PHACADRAFT_211566 [Phanerochaete carnosa HHB-10118-sp]EKM52292.1 hypothetical protein PHACADRAFT_211566 [Phanerochaete carnosa HHB-10118-sp]
MSAAVLPSHTVLNLTFGSLLLGTFASAVFYGIICQQCLTFFHRFAKESLVLKSCVAAVWVIDSAHLAFAICSVYILLMNNMGQLSGVFPSTFVGVTMTTAVSDTFVRGMFVYRLWIMSEKQWAVLVIPIILSVANLGAAVSATIEIVHVKTLVFTPALKEIFIADLVMLIVTDFYIAATICYFLRRPRRQVSALTLSITRTIMMYTINTGLVTSVAWLVCLITDVTMPNDFIQFGIYLPTNDLYNICLLTSLNARKHLRAENRGTVAILMNGINGNLQRPATGDPLGNLSMRNPRSHRFAYVKGEPTSPIQVGIIHKPSEETDAGAVFQQKSPV